MTDLEIALKTENTLLQAKLDAALEGNLKLSAQMQDLQEKLDIIINQFNKQKKKQYGSKNEHHNPRHAPENSNATGDDSDRNNHKKNKGGSSAPTKKFSRLKQKLNEQKIKKQRIRLSPT